jgi:hypothetical protein
MTSLTSRHTSARTRARSSTIKTLGTRAAAVLVIAAGMSFLAPGMTAMAAGGAISTTTNVTASTGNGGCVNPPSVDVDPVNCNTYADKEDVWLSNLPQALPDGDYYFAVLAPGGQPDPNGGAGLLSSDPYTDRTFNVTGSVVTATGTHPVENDQVQLVPFADTPNPGGVYIAAVCDLADYPAAANSCKYDAFKVGAEEQTPDPQGLTILKDATGGFTQSYAWSISKVADKTFVRKRIWSKTTINYSVTPSHEAGTITDVTVTGTISVFNPNDEAVEGATVTDELSDGTLCSVTGGSDATIEPGDNSFAYACALDALPDGQLDNTASVTWPEQQVGGSALAAGSAGFTFDSVSFLSTVVDACVEVTDTFAGALGTRCAGDAEDGTAFTYARVIKVLKGCRLYPNTATFTTDGTATTGEASASVKVCGFHVFKCVRWSPTPS